MSQALERLARRVKDDPFFLAAPLARYAAAEDLDDTTLAARLGCGPETLTGLRLCRNPDPQPPGFWNDVEVIAGRFGINPDVLAEVVRYGQNLIRLQHDAAAGRDLAPTDAGYLLAARDREKKNEVGDKPDGPPTGGMP